MEIFTGTYRVRYAFETGVGDYYEVYDPDDEYLGDIDYDSVESCHDDETDSYDYDKIDEIIESRFY